MWGCRRVCVRTVREVLQALVLDLKLQGVAEELRVVLHDGSTSKRGWGPLSKSYFLRVPRKKQRGRDCLRLLLQRKKTRRGDCSHTTHQHLHLRHVDGAHVSLAFVLLPQESLKPP